MLKKPRHDTANHKGDGTRLFQDVHEKRGGNENQTNIKVVKRPLNEMPNGNSLCMEKSPGQSR
jgi:hypothetical protein